MDMGMDMDMDMNCAHNRNTILINRMALEESGVLGLVLSVTSGHHLTSNDESLRCVGTLPIRLHASHAFGDRLAAAAAAKSAASSSAYAPCWAKLAFLSASVARTSGSLNSSSVRLAARPASLALHEASECAPGLCWVGLHPAPTTALSTASASCHLSGGARRPPP